MKHRIFSISLLIIFSYVGCNTPSAHYDIHDEIAEINLTGNWQVTLDFMTISEMPDQSFFIPIWQLEGCDNGKLNPEYLNPDEIVGLFHILKGHQIGVTMDLSLLKHEHHYDAALGIADFEKDILANVNEQLTRDLFEIYNPTESDFKLLSMAGVFDDNELRLLYEMDSFQLLFIGELISEEGEFNRLEGDFFWNTELFLIEGKWKASQSF